MIRQRWSPGDFKAFEGVPEITYMTFGGFRGFFKKPQEQNSLKLVDRVLRHYKTFKMI